MKRKNKAAKSEAGFRGLGVIAAVALVVVAAYLMGPKDRPMGSRPETAARTAPAEAYRFQGNPDPAARREIPWVTFATAVDGTMAFALEKRLGCTPGDYDAMAGDLMRSDRKELLVSLEPLDGSAVEPQSFVLTADAMRKGYRGKLRFPRDGKRHQLGLFLCKDSDGTRRCLQKAVKKVDAIIWENSQELAKDAPTQAPDRIYFFQYLLVEKDGSVLSFRHAPVPPQAFDVLESRIPEWFPAEAQASELQAARKARELSSAVVSLPLRQEDKFLRVTLPAHDVYRQCSPVVADGRPLIGR